MCAQIIQEDTWDKYNQRILYQCRRNSEMKEGMHNGVKDENGAIAGKISDTTAGIYLRCCRAVWNKCVHEGYLKDIPYPFSNKKEKARQYSQERKA